MVREFGNKNYWAIILGGSSGLGLATAKKLAGHGMNICIVHRSRKSDLPEIGHHFSEITEKKVELLSFNRDLLNSANKTEMILDLKKAMGEKGKIKCLVHSVAKGNLKPMVADDPEAALNLLDFSLTINAMALSLYDWVTAVFGEGLFAPDARVISFTSEGGRKALANYAAVSAAKASLEAITRNIALEFAPHGIRANCIQAGVTDTASLRMIPHSDKIKEIAVKRNPFHRLTLAEDVANAVYLLCKKEAAWINGCIIPVDGGEHLS